MTKLIAIVLVSCFAWNAKVIDAQTRGAEYQRTLEKVLDENTTDQAAAAMMSAAETNKEVRRYLGEDLPAVILKRRGEVWINAMQLAGNLKISGTVYALTELLKRGDTKIGPISMGIVYRLDDDPAGKALAKIGEPAVDAVAAILNTSPVNTRWRAAIILGNMNSAKGDQVLQAHLRNESDPGIAKYIEGELQNRRSSTTP